MTKTFCFITTFSQTLKSNIEQCLMFPASLEFRIELTLVQQRNYFLSFMNMSNKTPYF